MQYVYYHVFIYKFGIKFLYFNRIKNTTDFIGNNADYRVPTHIFKYLIKYNNLNSKVKSSFTSHFILPTVRITQ